MVLLSPSSAWSVSLRYALATRVVFGLVAVLSSWLLMLFEFGPPDTGALDMWRRWDAHHFLTIAEHGYTAPESDAHAAAFFPAFPLAVRAVMITGVSAVVAGLLVATAASVVAGYFLYRLAEREFGPEAARRAVVYLNVFPTAVFLLAPYSESLFLAGAIASFYFAREGRWHLVGIPAAVAMGARAAGLFLIFGLLFEFLRQRDFTRLRVGNASISLAVGILPLLAYGAFLAQAMGDPFEFITHQREGWGRTFVGPVASFWNTWNTWDVASYPTNWLLAWRMEIVAAAAGLAAVIWALTRREWGYAAFMGSMLLALVTSTWYYSIPRMLLSMFPIVLFLSEASERRGAVHEWLVVGSSAVATMGVVIYTRGIWFY
ncbi:MAG: mannosyltransferase family protein [Actinomycetota bacterium]